MKKYEYQVIDCHFLIPRSGEKEGSSTCQVPFQLRQEFRAGWDTALEIWGRGRRHRWFRAEKCSEHAWTFSPNQHFRPGKVVHLKKWTSFSRLFRLDRTDPLSFGPKFLEILVEIDRARQHPNISPDSSADSGRKRSFYAKHHGKTHSPWELSCRKGIFRSWQTKRRQIPRCLALEFWRYLSQDSR